jgi:hypothetical protein
MSRYTDSVRARARRLYEDTDQPIRSIAAELGIGDNTLQRMKISDSWARRCERLRGLPVALQLLEQTKVLAASGPHPSRLGAARLAPSGQSPRAGSQDDGARPIPTLPLAEGGSQSPIDQIEALVVNAIADEKAARTQFVGQRHSATASERSARTLATLTQTLRALQQMRTGKPLEPEMNDDDDDIPRDLDEFRIDLARRIDAFVASRTDAADAGGNSAPAPMEADE